jgi:hypothetical protein
MKDAGRFVSLNYFILPGFTDSEQEFAALCRFIEELSPDFIQLRNLNMDPEWYLATIGAQATDKDKSLGIREWFRQLQNCFPALRYGYFNPSLDPSCTPLSMIPG